MINYFVGRKEQLDKIDDYLHNDKKYIYIHGPGGIGKTKLIKEIARKYSLLGYKCTRVIDFSKTDNRDLPSLLTYIATGLGIGHFKKYIETANLLYSARGEERVLLAQKMVEYFIDDYNLYSSKQKIILIFDTFELLSKSELALSFFPPLLHFTAEGSKIILASRERKIPFSFRNDTGDKLELPGLTPEDVSELVEYRFHKAGIKQLPDKNSIQRICYLSNCNPLIVDLVICAILETGNKDVILGSSGEVFKRKIVEWIPELKSPLESQAIIQASVLDRRYNSQIMAAINQKDLHFCEEVLDGLVRFPFVKTVDDPDQKLHLEFRLHDEFRFMVNKYLVKDEYKREFIYPGIIEFYKTSYESHLKKPEADYAKIERIYYELRLDIDKGFSSWEKSFEEYLNQYDLEICQSLLEEIDKWRPSIEKLQQYKINLLEGEFLLANYDPLTAFPKFEFLSSSYIDPVKYPEILIRALRGLGQCIINNCTINDKEKLIDALKHLEEAIAIAESNSSQVSRIVLGSLLETLGYIHQLLGDHLLAEKYYKQALDVFEKSKSYMKQGELLDKIGSFYREQYRTDEALESYSNSLKLKTKAKDKRGIAITYSRMALAFVDKSEFDKSETLYLKARDILVDVDDQAELATVYGGLAWLNYIASRNKDVDRSKKLTQAELYAKQAINISEEKRFGRSLSRDYHTLYHVLDAQGNITRAEEYVRLSCDYARRYSDLFMLFDDLTHIAKIEYERGDYSKVPSYLSEIENYERRGAKFSVFKGRLLVILGHIAIRTGKINQAIKLYDQGWAIIVQRRTSSTVPKLPIEIAEFTNNLNKIPITTEDLSRVVTKLIELWKQHEGLPDWDIVINKIKTILLNV